jgi:hypothetical protein
MSPGIDMAFNIAGPPDKTGRGKGGGTGGGMVGGGRGPFGSTQGPPKITGGTID